MLQLRRDTRRGIVAGLMTDESNADDGATLFRTGEDKNRLARRCPAGRHSRRQSIVTAIPCGSPAYASARAVHGQAMRRFIGALAPPCPPKSSLLQQGFE